MRTQGYKVNERRTQFMKDGRHDHNLILLRRVSSEHLALEYSTKEQQVSGVDAGKTGGVMSWLVPHLTADLCMALRLKISLRPARLPR